MPKGLIEGLLTFLGILFFFVLPMVARARNAAQRGRKLGGLQPAAPEEPVTAAAAAPIPAPPRSAVTLPPEPPPLIQAARPAQAPALTPTPAPSARGPHPPAALPALPEPGGLGRLRQLTPWQRAVVWAEILGPPRGLDGGSPIA